MKIFKIGGSLDSRGFKKYIQEIEVTETEKQFTGKNTRINKNKLMQIDTICVENHKTLKYFTYCIDGDQQKALDMIKKHIIERVKEYKSEIDILVNNINE